MSKPRLLWCGDAVTPTGFARVTHNIVGQLKKDWAIGILGINYQGDPHHYPYPIYPAMLGGDMYGVRRYPQMVEHTNPDVAVILNDPWIVARYLDRETNCPVVAYMPIDGLNQPREAVGKLNRLTHAVFYTDFGLEEARAAGYTGPASVIPHGVDTDLYQPEEKAEALDVLGLRGQLPDDVFIVGNVNRNQPRKRVDLTLMYFAHWVEQFDIPDNVRLLIHCARKDLGPDIVSLARYLGIKNRLILTSTAATSMSPGLPEEAMRHVYNAMDVQVTTTLGEGWGLTTHEGMACGIPQVAPRWSALREWARGAAALVPVDSYEAINESAVIGGVAGQSAFVGVLDLLYHDPDYRDELARKGLERAREPRFRWETIGKQFHELLSSVKEETNGPAGGTAEFFSSANATPA